ncbi:UNVERIFIED_CONTAM: hypothetical protein FKN15_077184 [Acipenser sinensis]
MELVQESGECPEAMRLVPAILSPQRAAGQPALICSSQLSPDKQDTAAALIAGTKGLLSTAHRYRNLKGHGAANDRKEEGHSSLPLYCTDRTLLLSDCWVHMNGGGKGLAK